MMLTFDPALLAWLRTRISLWLMHVGLLTIAAFGLAGCVPVTRYEQAHSAAEQAHTAAESERLARQRSEQELARVRQQNQTLNARVAEQSRALDAREAALSQATFDTDTAGKQRQDAEGLVEQLRSELARAGEHMRSYQGDQQKLEENLAESARVHEAERAATEEKSRELGRLARDTTLALAAAIAAGNAGLEAEESGLVLRLPAAELARSNESGGPTLAAALSRVVQEHAQVRLRASNGELKAALVAAGVAEDRFDAELAEPAAPPSQTDATEDAGPAPAAARPLLHFIVP